MRFHQEGITKRRPKRTRATPEQKVKGKWDSLPACRGKSDEFSFHVWIPVGRQKRAVKCVRCGRKNRTLDASVSRRKADVTKT